MAYCSKCGGYDDMDTDPWGCQCLLLQKPPLPLSEAAQAARRPRPPAEYADALQDSVHIDVYRCACGSSDFYAHCPGYVPVTLRCSGCNATINSAEEERANIIAWLRTNNDSGLADAIEAGEHLKK